MITLETCNSQVIFYSRPVIVGKTGESRFRTWQWIHFIVSWRCKRYRSFLLIKTLNWQIKVVTTTISDFRHSFLWGIWLISDISFQEWVEIILATSSFPHLLLCSLAVNSTDWLTHHSVKVLKQEKRRWLDCFPHLVSSHPLDNSFSVKEFCCCPSNLYCNRRKEVSIMRLG